MIDWINSRSRPLRYGIYLGGGHFIWFYSVWILGELAGNGVGVIFVWIFGIFPLEILWAFPLFAILDANEVIGLLANLGVILGLIGSTIYLSLGALIGWYLDWRQKHLL